MAAFRSEGELHKWLNSRGRQPGAIVAPQTLYELGAEWYVGRLDVEFQPRTASEKQGLFAKYGLRGEFWSIEA